VSPFCLSELISELFARMNGIKEAAK
jgi:hypothetical protein